MKKKVQGMEATKFTAAELEQVIKPLMRAGGKTEQILERFDAIMKLRAASGKDVKTIRF